MPFFQECVVSIVWCRGFSIFAYAKLFSFAQMVGPLDAWAQRVFADSQIGSKRTRRRGIVLLTPVTGGIATSWAAFSMALIEWFENKSKKSKPFFSAHTWQPRQNSFTFKSLFSFFQERHWMARKVPIQSSSGQYSRERERDSRESGSESAFLESFSWTENQEKTKRTDAAIFTWPERERERRVGTNVLHTSFWGNEIPLIWTCT